MSRFARFAVWALASSVLLAPSVRAEPASGSGVTVDWGALDALGPAKTHTPSVVLKPPPGAKPKAAVALAPPKQAAAPKKPPVKQASLPKPATKPIVAKPTEVATPRAPADAALLPESAAPPPPNVKPIAPPPAKVASTARAPLPAAALSPTAPVVSRRVSFDPGKSELSPEVQAALDDVATRMTADASLRLELDAYADAAGADSIDARRLSRARAEAMRAYLVDKGISVVRVDLRALGNKADDTLPADRVDLVFLEH
jgi:outer membrane protein OmpA-like peptidoglycan-associated protein